MFSKTIQIRDLLAGFKPGQPQIVANMAVIPLLSAADTFSGIAGAENVVLDRDNDYASLHLKPVEPKLTIVPNGFTYLTKERAQDRAVPGVHVIEDSREVHAYCVQSSQCGHMKASRQQDREFHFLPMAIRHHAFGASVVKGDRDYNGLWGKLGEYNRSLGVKGDYLVSLMDQYAQQLDQFVAQFEPMTDQRGAIVLINGRVVGIDIFPSFHAYLQVWQTLIRDCYGTEAIQQRDDAPQTPIAPLREVTDMADLLGAVEAQIQAEKDWAYGITKECLDQTITEKQKQRFNSRQIGPVDISTVKTPELEGQVVASGGKAVYLSLFRHAYGAVKKVEAFPL